LVGVLKQKDVKQTDVKQGVFVIYMCYNIVKALSYAHTLYLWFLCSQ